VTPKKDWQPIFLDALKKSFNVTRAARAAGVSRKTAYQYRDNDGEFAEQWNDALGQGIDSAEAELYRRAVKGVVKPVYQGGAEVGKVREYSDTLLIFLLKSHRPKIYNQPVEQRLTGADGGPVEYRNVTDLSDEDLARIAATGSAGVAGQAPGAE